MKILKVLLVCTVISTSLVGCANPNLSKAASAGTEQTIRNQQESDNRDGNARSTKIEKESFINGAVAFVYCLFSSDKKCD